jgi:hypothetical protein
MELHQLMEMGEVATTTFAPLDKYVAANDNHQGGRYIGLRRQTLPVAERVTVTLDDLSGLSGYIYLGSPYSKYAQGLDVAAKIVAESAAILMRRGLVVFSPIAHGHVVANDGGLPALDWTFWQRQCDPLVDASAALVVLQMEGWWESVGLEYEIKRFRDSGKPIVYLPPAALGVWERRAA